VTNLICQRHECVQFFEKATVLGQIVLMHTVAMSSEGLMMSTRPHYVGSGLTGNVQQENTADMLMESKNYD